MCMPRCCRNIAARAPIQWAIANGEIRTGVTTMQIDAGLDTGDILLMEETEMLPGETALELGPRLAAMGADLLVRTLREVEAGTAHPAQAGRRTSHARTDSQERRWVDSLDPTRGDNRQSCARLSALARCLYAFPRAVAECLESATRHGNGTGRTRHAASAQASVAGRVRAAVQRWNSSNCNWKGASGLRPMRFSTAST